MLDLYKVIPDDDRSFLEYHLCSSCFAERKHRLGGWQRAPYFAGAGVDIDFNRTVLTPDEDDNPSKWLATSFGNNGGDGIHKSQLNKVESVFNFVETYIPAWSHVSSVDSLLKSLATKEYKIKNDYSYVWGDTYTQPEHGAFAPSFWVKFLVVNEPSDSGNVSGDVTTAAFGAAEDTQKHHFSFTENIQAASTNSVSTQSVEGTLYTESDRATLEQTKKELQELGIDTSGIDSVYTRE